MILDLFSTMVGSFGTIIIEAIVIGLIMLWALMDTGKKDDEQMGENGKCVYTDITYCRDCAERNDCAYSGKEWEA